VTMVVDERYALEQAAHCPPAVRSTARTKSTIGGTTGRVRGMNSVARAGRPNWRVPSLSCSGMGSDQAVVGHVVLQHVRCTAVRELGDDNDSQAAARERARSMAAPC
jgi:hypothetical protein